MHEAILTNGSLMAGAVVFGFLFGWLLQRGGVADYNVIVNQFRFKDFTVLKIMLTAVVVGGIGVAMLHAGGLANTHIKASPMLAIVLGSAIFGVGMVLYGYCPGTGLAAIGTGSLHALAGMGGMMLGGIVYALAFPWLAKNILAAGDIGKLTLDQLTGLPVWAVLVILTALALGVFALVHKLEKSRGG
jgi:uncharacterized membrane protein YedE/YeeE